MPVVEEPELPSTTIERALEGVIYLTLSSASFNAPASQIHFNPTVDFPGVAIGL